MVTPEISSLDELVPVYDEMSQCLHVFAEIKFHPGMNSSLSKRQGWKKKKKTYKHFILGRNFEMSMFFFFIFDVCIQICFPKLTCLNIMRVWKWWNIRPLYKKWSPKRKGIRTTSKKIKNVKTFLLFLLFSLGSLQKIEISFCFNPLP